MPQDKLPTDISSEELERLLKNNEVAQTTSQDLRDPILLFLATFDIKAGKNKVHISLLKNLYGAWKGEKVHVTEFVQTISKYLIRMRPAHFYGISLTPRQLSLLTDMEMRTVGSIAHATRYKNAFEGFMKARLITKGDFWVEGHVLFRMYGEFSEDRKKGMRMSYNNFVKTAKLFLQCRNVVVKGECFKVSETIREFLPKEELEEVRKNWKKQYDR